MGKFTVRDIMALWGLAGLLLMIFGCVENAPALDDRDRPSPNAGQPAPMGGSPDVCGQNVDDVCDGGMLSDQPCSDEEESCAVIELPIACDTPLFCRRPVECPAIDPVCPPGLVGCDNLNDPMCRTIETGEPPCQQLIACRDEIQCPAIAYACPDGTVPCDPMSDSNCTERGFGEGACMETLYCTPGMACTEPACVDDEQQSDRPCINGEPDCRRVKACDEIVYCRILAQCDAVPVCRDGAEGSARPCEANEEGCAPVFECGDVIFCRQAACDAVPECGPSENQSQVPCDDGDGNCRVVDACGVQAYCRRSPDESLLPLTPCAETDLPVDVFSIETAEVDGDVLRVRVSASGGCEPHVFSGCRRPVIPEEPTQFRITLGHDANGDACEGLIMEDLAFDLRPLQAIYLMLIGQRDRQISLFITDYAMPLIYEF
ncbi:MAG: hypothetical protein VX589_05375 [Myxococcota bacterium]|nr:hypothetical protein [Myxococcota bacterium]